MKVSKLHARGGVVSAPSVLAMNVLDLKVCLTLFVLQESNLLPSTVALPKG